MTGPEHRPRRPGSDRGPRPLSESLDALTRGLTEADLDAVAGVFGRWKEIAGPTIAAHVRPLRLTGEVLVVAVDHPAWATQVRSVSRSLLARVGESTGTEPGRLEVVVRTR